MTHRLQLVLLTVALSAFTGVGTGEMKKPLTAGPVGEAAKEFVEQLVDADFSGATAMFDATMMGALPPPKLKETWLSLNAQVGAFKRENGVRLQRYQQFNVAFVTCEFEKGVIDVKIVFDTTNRIAGLFFVPGRVSPVTSETPSPAGSKEAGESEVQIGTGTWAVRGTLSMPSGSGPFPAVVLVHGSGPQDRDETIGPNKPFRDLAEGLVSRGIAVLRYEKRTKEHAAEIVLLRDSLTVKEECIDDALAAVSLLEKTALVNAGKVFVLGHSLGGTLAPRIGLLNPNIAGLIIMAGGSRPLEDLILEQLSYLFSLDGGPTADQKTQLDHLRLQVAKVKDPKLSAATPSTDLPMGVPARYWLDLRGYDPVRTAGNAPQPILFLQGERDYQVTLEDFRGWQKALSGTHRVEFKSYPSLNHLFIEGTGKSIPAEYSIPGHVSPQVIDDIAHWIKAR